MKKGRIITAVTGIAAICCFLLAGCNGDPRQLASKWRDGGKSQYQLLAKAEGLSFDKIKREEAKRQAVKRNKKKSKRPASPNDPNIEFDVVTYNVGNVFKGDKIEHEFGFTNTGGSTLVIEKAKAG